MLVENGDSLNLNTTHVKSSLKKSLHSCWRGAAASPLAPESGPAYSRWFDGSRRRPQWLPKGLIPPSEMRLTICHDWEAAPLKEPQRPIPDPVYHASVRVSSSLPFSTFSWRLVFVVSMAHPRKFQLSIFRINQETKIPLDLSPLRSSQRHPFLWNLGEAIEEIYEKYKYFVHQVRFCGILWW